MITQKVFGRTGHQSSRIIFGAANLWKASVEDRANTIQSLLKYGINHVDVAASYGEGRAEKEVGLWMKEHRERFFLSTKTGKRTYREAKEEFANSLQRLSVDYVDMIQLHNLTDPSDQETALGPGGALEALVEARDKGLTRFIGVTGHGYYAPERHLSSIERFPFDAVLLPYNYMMVQNVQYLEFLNRLLNRCRELSVAVQTIKSIARRPWTSKERTHACWYEPLAESTDIERAVHWALGNQDVFVISSSDVTLLPKILDAAARFTERPTDAQMRELISSRECAAIFEGARTISP